MINAFELNFSQFFLEMVSSVAYITTFGVMVIDFHKFLDCMLCCNVQSEFVDTFSVSHCLAPHLHRIHITNV
jgi:hypothetical protein